MDTGLKVKKSKSVIGDLMKKVDGLPEKESHSLEDSIKTMMQPWKNNDSQKWNDIIKKQRLTIS